MKYRSAPPKPAAMIEALRGMGYSLETALADLIDNSISAGAQNVNVIFRWNGGLSWIAVVDDGSGMSDSELESAMRLGDVNPLETRSQNDLGRFGLGLKTASFSQARQLTVTSNNGLEISSLRWNLDTLSNDSSGEWKLLEGCDPNSAVFPEDLLIAETGTVVLWDYLDRIVTDKFSETDFYALIDRVSMHLSMVFHRFLDSRRPKFQLKINDRVVSGWDPFLEHHEGTWKSPIAPIGRSIDDVVATAFILPHKDRLSDKEFDVAAGPNGWSGQQGFYVYRGERLLVAGSWLGLGRGRAWTKDEAHRLVRIRLDISNRSDINWKIDIRKSQAAAPVWLRDQLLLLAENVRARARRVFYHRATENSPTTRATDVIAVWNGISLKSGVKYKIDRKSPVVQNIMDLAPQLSDQIELLLRVIEETVPVQRIWLDTSESGEAPRGGFSDDPPDQVKTLIKLAFQSFVRSGLSAADAKARLSRTEPFDLYIDHILTLEEV